MLDLFGHEKTVPFAVALSLMGLLLVMELITMVFGSALSGVLEGVLPDLNADVDGDLGASVEASGQLSLAAFLTWLKLDELPALVVLIVFLACFGLIGVAMRSMIATLVGEPMRASVATDHLRSLVDRREIDHSWTGVKSSLADKNSRP